MKPSGQDRFDSMNLNPHMAGGNPHDLRNGRCIEAFEVQQHHVTFKRFQFMDQFEQPIDRHSLIRVPYRVGTVGKGFDLLETEEFSRSCPVLTDDMRRCRIVRNSVYPCTKRTSGLVLFQTEPQGEMNILQEISPLVGIRLMSPREPLKRGAMNPRRFPIEVLLRAHIHIVGGIPVVLQKLASTECFMPRPAATLMGASERLSHR